MSALFFPLVTPQGGGREIKMANAMFSWTIVVYVNIFIFMSFMALSIVCCQRHRKKRNPEEELNAPVSRRSNVASTSTGTSDYDGGYYGFPFVHPEPLNLETTYHESAEEYARSRADTIPLCLQTFDDERDDMCIMTTRF